LFEQQLFIDKVTYNRENIMRSNGEIDKIDLKILDRLEADARTDLKDIAEECS